MEIHRHHPWDHSSFNQSKRFPSRSCRHLWARSATDCLCCHHCGIAGGLGVQEDKEEEDVENSLTPSELQEAPFLPFSRGFLLMLSVSAPNTQFWVSGCLQARLGETGGKCETGCRFGGSLKSSRLLQAACQHLLFTLLKQLFHPLCLVFIDAFVEKTGWDVFIPS